MGFEVLGLKVTIPFTLSISLCSSLHYTVLKTDLHTVKYFCVYEKFSKTGIYLHHVQVVALQDHVYAILKTSQRNSR